MHQNISKRSCAAALVFAMAISMYSATAKAVVNVSQGVVAHRAGLGTQLVSPPQMALTNSGDLYFTYLTPDENDGTPAQGSMKLLQTGSQQILSVWASTNKGARMSAPSVSADGELAFVDSGADDVPLLVTAASGGNIITIRGENFSKFGAPTYSTGIQVQHRRFFTGDTPAGNSFVLASDPNISGGSIITIVGFQAQAPLGTHHLMVGNGDVISLRATSAGSNTPFIAQIDGGNIITISGSNWASVSEPGGRGDNLVFSFDDGSNATLVSKWGHNIAKPIIGNIKARVISPTGNSGGVVVYGLGGALGTPAIDDMQSIYWTNNYGENPTEIIAIGDILDGQAVTKLSYSPDSLNDNGQFAYYAMLADGSEHLYITEALPEPASAMVLLSGCGAMMLRRARKIR